jgi:hypothetical protein
MASPSMPSSSDRMGRAMWSSRACAGVSDGSSSSAQQRTFFDSYSSKMKMDFLSTASAGRYDRTPGSVD